MQPIAVYHEHPDWFKPLFVELERRGLPYERVDAASHVFDPSEDDVPYSLVFNRASPSAYLRGHRQSTFHTLHWLRHLERVGVPVVNGAHVYAYELSRASQLDLLEELGLDRKSTRLNSSHSSISYAVFCLKKKNTKNYHYHSNNLPHDTRSREIGSGNTLIDTAAAIS